MNWLKKIFGTAKDSPATAPTPGEGSSFPSSMLRHVTLGIINYEGTRDPELQQRVVEKLLPLANGKGGFKTYCNASVPALQSGEPACGFIQFNGGNPKSGVSLDTYMAYIASKDSFPPGCPREFADQRIGYWIGSEKGKKVHAVLLLD